MTTVVLLQVKRLQLLVVSQQLLVTSGCQRMTFSSTLSADSRLYVDPGYKSTSFISLDVLSCERLTYNQENTVVGTPCILVSLAFQI